MKKKLFLVQEVDCIGSFGDTWKDLKLVKDYNAVTARTQVAKLLNNKSIISTGFFRAVEKSELWRLKEISNAQKRIEFLNV